MSEVRLVIRDAERDIHADRHGSFADAVIAALSAEPETIEELEVALERFIARGKEAYFRGFASGVRDEPYDAGLVIIDLAARLVVCDSTYSAARLEGAVEYHDGKGATEVPVRFHLSDGWYVTEDVFGWSRLAENRRQSRRLAPRVDVRDVVYGKPLLQFIVERCFEAFQDQGAAAEPDEADPQYQREYDILRDIHAQWLMTPRDELRGRTPRQAMTARRRFSDESVHDRELQWSYMNRCAPGLDPESAAYRFAGFGTHELVVYYDLVRELLWCCRGDVAQQWSCSRPVDLTRDAFAAAEIDRLGRFREQWLDSPYPESSSARTPRGIIHNERARIPETMSGQEAVIDPDCPFCRLQAKLPGPIFWHLDACNMDDDFAFSFRHESFGEWAREKRKQEEFDLRFDAIWAERKRLGVEYPGNAYVNPDIAWKMSFSERRFPEAPLDLRLYAVGEPLSELIVDLRKPPPGTLRAETEKDQGYDDLEGSLRDTFCALRERIGERGATGDHAAVLRLLVRLRDALGTVSRARPDLTFQCVDLQERLGRFLEPPSETDGEDWFVPDELPF
ncbi:MAG: hypothetical protein WAO20_00640 [Acidobacteriota bacterium]